MNFKHLLLLSLLGASFAACSRPSKDTAHVTIQLPSTANKTIFTSSETASTSTIDPGSLANINCYMAITSGPEFSSMCGRLGSDGTLQTSTAFMAGPWVSGASGAVLELNVPAGNDRQFTLVGTYAASALACSRMAILRDPATMSKYYTLGRSEKVNLTANVDAKVEIPMTFDAENWFDRCVGPDFDMKIGSIEPTTITVTKDSFPIQKILANTCQPIEVRLTDNLGRDAVYTADYIEGTINGYINGSATAIPINTYEDKSKCSDDNNAENEFRIIKGTTSITRWYKADVASSYIKFKPTMTRGPASITPNMSSDFLRVTATDLSYYLVGPNKVLPDVC